MFIVDQLVATFFVNIISFFMPYGGNTFAREALIRINLFDIFGMLSCFHLTL